MRPAALRIANARGVPGMITCLVRDGVGRWSALSNHHVVFGEGAAAGDAVWAIPPNDDDGSRAVRLGSARNGRIGRVTFQGDTVFVDCALVELADRENFPHWLNSAINEAWPTEIGPVQPGIRVFKFGAATGLTGGVLVDVAYPDYPTIEGRSWIASGQLLVDSLDPALNFCAPGDSGAALVDECGRMLGLMWGSNLSGQGIGCPIEPVLDVELAQVERTTRRSA
jgi:hypothetical protein